MKTIVKGQRVYLDTLNENCGYITGVTIEDISLSPTNRDQERQVVRVKWDDGSETIENTKDLY